MMSESPKNKSGREKEGFGKSIQDGWGNLTKDAPKYMEGIGKWADETWKELKKNLSE